MRKRYALIIVVLIVGGLGAIKASQIGSLIKFGKEAAANGPPPQTIGTGLATKQSWQGTLSSVGTVTTVRGVTVSNDAPGVISSIQFESGAKVTKGQVLVSLDSSVEQAQLASIRVRHELAELTLKRTQALVQSGSIGQAQLDADEAALKGTIADAAAVNAQIARKVVRAPFAGRLGIRMVNVGQYVNPGTAMTSLESTDSVYVDFALPQQNAGEAHVGTPVLLEAEGQPPLEGVVAAIDPALDASTRSIKLRASVSKKTDALHPGMFVRVSVHLPTGEAVVSVPMTAVVHASYGDSVFVVETKETSPGKPAKVARQQFVRTGRMQGDFVSIESGLKAGEEVVTAGAFKLRNGAVVLVRNDVKSDPSVDPRPENR